MRLMKTTMDQAVWAFCVLITQSRASLMCDKERIENSKTVTKRSQLLLAELSTAMDPQEWLLAQSTVPAAYPETNIPAQIDIRKNLRQLSNSWQYAGDERF
jgi:hypothetical protein